MNGIEKEIMGMTEYTWIAEWLGVPIFILLTCLSLLKWGNTIIDLYLNLNQLDLSDLLKQNAVWIWETLLISSTTVLLWINLQKHTKIV